MKGHTRTTKSCRIFEGEIVNLPAEPHALVFGRNSKLSKGPSVRLAEKLDLGLRLRRPEGDCRNDPPFQLANEPTPRGKARRGVLHGLMRSPIAQTTLGMRSIRCVYEFREGSEVLGCRDVAEGEQWMCGHAA